MTSTNTRRRLALAGMLAVTALGSAAPAQADAGDKEERCEARLERIENRFREIEERRGWEAAAEWWNDKAWPNYYKRCLAP